MDYSALCLSTLENAKSMKIWLGRGYFWNRKKSWTFVILRMGLTLKTTDLKKKYVFFYFHTGAEVQKTIVSEGYWLIIRPVYPQHLYMHLSA